VVESDDEDKGWVLQPVTSKEATTIQEAMERVRISKGALYWAVKLLCRTCGGGSNDF